MSCLVIPHPKKENDASKSIKSYILSYTAASTLQAQSFSSCTLVRKFKFTRCVPLFGHGIDKHCIFSPGGSICTRMYPSMQRNLLLSSSARPCRFIARRRYPAVTTCTLRRFHDSGRWLSSAPYDPRSTADTPVTANDVSPADTEERLPEQKAPNHTTSSAEECTKKGPSPYGSGVRRAMRNKKPAKNWTPPAATIPDWFFERNTVFNNGEQHNDLLPHQVKVDGSLSERSKSPEEESTYGTGPDGDDRPGGSDEQPGSRQRYALAEALWEELRASVKAGLKLPPSKYANEPSALKSHLVLQYPGNDGILFLDAVVRRLANELGIDLVTLNAQDIAELCSEHDMADSGMSSPIRSLSYDVYRPSQVAPWQDPDDGMGDGEGDDVDTPRSMRSEAPKFITIESTGNLGDTGLPGWLGLKSVMSSLGGQSSDSRGPDNRAEHRWLRLINGLLSSSGKKQPPQLPLEDEESPVEPEAAAARKASKARNVIVQVQDYKDIQGTREGSTFISLLQQAIQKRRQEGSRVLLVGTVAKELTPSIPQDVPFDDNFSRTLVVTPATGQDLGTIFTEDRKRRTMDINIRHLQEMLRTRINDPPSSAVEDGILTSREWPLSVEVVKSSGLDDRYWSYSQVHWVVTLALGCIEANEPLGYQHIERGINLMQKTDSIKNDWLQEKTPKSQFSEAGNGREQLLKSLRKTCNSHEKKLLNGVVDAKSIHTTFSDVHVAPQAIDTLKTLTSLSLIRPEAFTYGVLARDKIPGLLLYGPPGTGKTLLAKAVAHESGATVLEVSGSDVYDMYVGEGEKNVKAIFTLAKKLSPCVVFIDEADAIFGSRTGASGRTSHRELINQFLREWDGMNDLSAFIMVATNRPFDLDDAVLRRLPRRLLVDLPTEADRLSIFKIHLKDEILDASVDLSELSSRTSLYSGSDLKNVCVAAALSCVRQENEQAAQYQGDQPYEYPARRTLTREHFERGMEEISASISEDMSSLTAIRKFDEQYGDQKSRRKKGAGWGFVPPNSVGSGLDSARVRT